MQRAYAHDPATFDTWTARSIRDYEQRMGYDLDQQRMALQGMSNPYLSVPSGLLGGIASVFGR